MYNTTTYMYNQNHYTVSEWAQMEAAGAVFLPAAGQRQYYSSYASFFMVNIDVEACYWTSDRHEVADALYLGSSSDAGIGKCSEMIYQGMSVRLVRDL